MRKEDVRMILPGVLAGNGEDAKLLEWCKEHLPAVLKAAGIHKWIPPYYASVSEYSEDYKHTWASGESAILHRKFMDVFDTNTNACIGRVPISSFKSTIAICELIKRNGQWYLLTADSRIKIYSLPELTLVAEGEENFGKIFDIWCPRLHSHLHVYDSCVTKEERAYYSCAIDDDIEDGDEWESTLFAFVDSYDPYSSGPDYVHMLDLREFTNGIVKSQFLMEKPSHLSLRSSINIEHWTKEWPTIEIAKYDCISTVDNSGPNGSFGWGIGQLEYFNWAGEIEDERTSGQIARKKAIEWANHPDCLFLSEKLGVAYDRTFYDHVHSNDEAESLAKTDPGKLKTIVLHNFRNGAIYNGMYAISGLAHLEPCAEIRDVLRYIAKKGKHAEFRKAAKEALMKAYPEDALMKRFTRWIGGLGQ